MIALTPQSRSTILRFAASFAWSDLDLEERETAFLLDLARELDIEMEAELLARPPPPDDVDPLRVDPALADTIRQAALRAIAADGRVLPGEMEMFDLLDALLPRTPRRSRTQRAPASATPPVPARVAPRSPPGAP